MNVRISNGQIRFRISAKDVAELLQGENISLTLTLANAVYKYHIQTGELPTPLSLHENANQFTLIIDRNTLAEFEKQLPSRAGIEHEEKLANGLSLKLILEVDIR
jgi:hypothetical protein